MEEPSLVDAEGDEAGHHRYVHDEVHLHHCRQIFEALPVLEVEYGHDIAKDDDREAYSQKMWLLFHVRINQYEEHQYEQKRVRLY